MKKLTWQQWTAIGIVLAVIITAVVLHLVQPTVSFAFTEIIGVGAFVLGAVCGYLFKNKIQ